MRRALSILFLVSSLGVPSHAQDFWKHWGDGKAELNGYSLEQPRYGAVRSGTAILVYVTEDFSDSLRVKADPGKHPASDVYPVLKLNAVRDFQTGIYDYNVMTSTFLRVAAGLAGGEGQLLEPGVVRPRLAPARPARREAVGDLPQLLRRRSGRNGRSRARRRTASSRTRCPSSSAAGTAST